MENSSIIAIVTICAAVLIFLFKICFASKCEQVSICCGLLVIEREVSLESKIYRQNSDPMNFPNIEEKIESKIEEKINNI